MNSTGRYFPITTARIHLRNFLTLDDSMDRLCRSSDREPPVDSVRLERRGSVFERESFLGLAFGEGSIKLGLDGDFIGVLGSSRSTDTMDGRRGLRFRGVSVLESDLRERLKSPMSSSSDIMA